MGKYTRYGFLRKKLGGRLFQHCLGVAAMAKKLAAFYGVEEDLLYTAGLWHDYGKPYSFSDLKKKAQLMGLQLDNITLQSHALLHGPVGAGLAINDGGIKDMRIIRAIACHTMGAPSLGIFEKIIYLADAIEEKRSYPGVEQLRKLAFQNFDKTLLKVLDNTIRKVITSGEILHPDSIAFRNELIINLSKKRR